MHALTGALDDIVDFAEEAADQLGLYGVEAPMVPAQEMAEVLVGASEHVAGGLRGLRNGHDPAPHLVEIHRLENEADRIVREALASLFATGIDPMIVIRWKDIFESLEAAVDACETVANVLEGITLKRGWLAGGGGFFRAPPGAGDEPGKEKEGGPDRKGVPAVRRSQAVRFGASGRRRFSEGSGGRGGVIKKRPPLARATSRTPSTNAESPATGC